jgi:hypothetical protein
MQDWNIGRYTMGYVHDTGFAQFIPPTAFHYVTGTWTDAAGVVAGTIVKKKAAAAQTSVITVPITVPSNSLSLKGAMLNAVDVDYEITNTAATSVTMAMNKVTRGANTAVAVVAAVTGTQTLVADSTAASVDQHRDTWTITTPAYIDDDEQYLLEITAICADSTVLEYLGAVAKYTFRA